MCEAEEAIVFVRGKKYICLSQTYLAVWLVASTYMQCKDLHLR